MMTELIHCLPI